MSEKYISASAFKKLFECDKEAIDAELEKYAEKYNLDDAGKEAARYVFYGVIDIINESIDNIPAADVEPVVRGEWIEHYDECECPVCGETWNYCDNDTERFDCCPKCGARLVEHGKERER